MFRIYDKQNNTYEGNVTSPDNVIIARNDREVIELIKHIGIINITGRDEMLLTNYQFKGCVQLDDGVIFE